MRAESGKVLRTAMEDMIDAYLDDLNFVMGVIEACNRTWISSRSVPISRAAEKASTECA